MSLWGAGVAALAGKESRKETLWKFSLEMGAIEERTQPGQGDPSAGYSPFTCMYSPCGAASLKNQSILHEEIKKPNNVSEEWFKDCVWNVKRLKYSPDSAKTCVRGLALGG